MAGAKINVIAADAVAAGEGRFGMLFWVAPRDYNRLRLPRSCPWLSPGRRPVFRELRRGLDLGLQERRTVRGPRLTPVLKHAHSRTRRSRPLCFQLHAPRGPCKLTPAYSEWIAQLNLQAHESENSLRRLPGEAGVWVFIFGDLIVFSLFFVLVMIDVGQEPETYRQSQGALSQSFGLLNTVLMLSSSWFVAHALRAARNAQGAVASALFGFAALCGLCFGIVKFFEWRAAFAAGHTVNTNNFYMYYFVFTGIHFMHVLIGMAVLAAMAIYSRGAILGERQLRMLEGGSCFWHVVDILWLILFALFYLIRM